MLKEQQKCDGGCFYEAFKYCEAEFPPKIVTNIRPGQPIPLSKKYKNYQECAKTEYQNLADIFGESQQVKITQELKCRDAFFE